MFRGSIRFVSLEQSSMRYRVIFYSQYSVLCFETAVFNISCDKLLSLLIKTVNQSTSRSYVCCKLLSE